MWLVYLVYWLAYDSCIFNTLSAYYRSMICCVSPFASNFRSFDLLQNSFKMRASPHLASLATYLVIASTPAASGGTGSFKKRFSLYTSRMSQSNSRAGQYVGLPLYDFPCGIHIILAKFSLSTLSPCGAHPIFGVLNVSKSPQGSTVYPALQYRDLLLRTQARR